MWRYVGAHERTKTGAGLSKNSSQRANCTGCRAGHTTVATLAAAPWKRDIILAIYLCPLPFHSTSSRDRSIEDTIATCTRPTMASRKGEKVVVETMVEENHNVSSSSSTQPLLSGSDHDDESKTKQQQQLPLEQQQQQQQHHSSTMTTTVTTTATTTTNSTTTTSSPSSSSCDGKKIVGFLMFTILCLLLWDSFVRPPEERFLKPQAAADFLRWVESNPYWGIGAFLLAFAVSVVMMIPIGTPLTLGCGYIYKGVYGWTAGVAVATLVSMGGSALGAVSCFLLGRYLMRDRVRKWVRKYPIFDAIDIAVSEHGLRIMAMLYLTPVLPLGPISYMCGSTSMALSSFVLAKIASLPLMLLYVYIGAAAGTLITDAHAIEQNSTLIISGIVLSCVMISCISHYIRKELMKVLENKKSGGKKEDGDDIELGTTTASTTAAAAALQKRNNNNNITGDATTALQRRYAAHPISDYDSESDSMKQSKAK